MGGSVSDESIAGPTSSGPVLEVIVLAAEDLKNVNMVGKMSVYVVAWMENDYKRSTSVRHKTGRNAVWNDSLSFPVSDDILQNPHSALTVQVFSTGTVSPSVVGTTYLALTDIARMKATKTNSEEGDIVTLPLHRPSGRTQGSIRISVNLCGATIQQMMYALDKGHDGWAIEMPARFSGVPDGVPVMGYPAVQPYGASSFYPPCSEHDDDDDDDHMAFLPSAPPLALAAPPVNPESRLPPPPPARPPPPLPSSSPFFSNSSNVDPHPCAQARNQYIPVQIRRQQEGRETFLMALISGVGGLVGGLVLGDIISAAL